MPSKKTQKTPKKKTTPSKALIKKAAPLPSDYPALLSKLKADIQASQIRASLSVNRELVLLYWRIGNAILERQKQESWGTKVIDHLAKRINCAASCCTNTLVS